MNILPTTGQARAESEAFYQKHVGRFFNVEEDEDSDGVGLRIEHVSHYDNCICIVTENMAKRQARTGFAGWTDPISIPGYQGYVMFRERWTGGINYHEECSHDTTYAQVSENVLVVGYDTMGSSGHEYCRHLEYMVHETMTFAMKNLHKLGIELLPLPHPVVGIPLMESIPDNPWEDEARQEMVYHEADVRVANVLRLAEGLKDRKEAERVIHAIALQWAIEEHQA